MKLLVTAALCHAPFGSVDVPNVWTSIFLITASSLLRLQKALYSEPINATRSSIEEWGSKACSIITPHATHVFPTPRCIVCHGSTKKNLGFPFGDWSTSSSRVIGPSRFHGNGGATTHAWSIAASASFLSKTVERAIYTFLWKSYSAICRVDDTCNSHHYGSNRAHKCIWCIGGTCTFEQEKMKKQNQETGFPIQSLSHQGRGDKSRHQKNFQMLLLLPLELSGRIALNCHLIPWYVRVGIKKEHIHPILKLHWHET